MQFDIQDIRLLRVNYSLGFPEGVQDGEHNSNDEDKQETSIDVEFSFTSAYFKEENILRVKMSAAARSQNPPFLLDTEMGGAFQFEECPANIELERARNINCPAILFPYLREFVTEISRRAGLEPIYLPPVNFVEIYKKKQGKEE